MIDKLSVEICLPRLEPMENQRIDLNTRKFESFLAAKVAIGILKHTQLQPAEKQN